jgi:hypothetical protein
MNSQQTSGLDSSTSKPLKENEAVRFNPDGSETVIKTEPSEKMQ